MPRGRGETLDDRRAGGFLEDDDVGMAGADDGQQRLLTAGPAALDVVTEEADGHSLFLSMSMR